MRRLWATALALQWLERRASHLALEWGMLAAKGRHWLDINAAPAKDARTWIERADAFLKF